ncbi:hypothetical protein H6P81_021500 [Aristolochia fimbriata]|uniref:ATP synthase subunit alpha, mitochondrial n=1 Tax=Aristolochia fimbriata TaxID=158543 RepID=A0AAV7DRF4_ARIFI|nr:hypothetical protein H6P81_021500 [Aristolochia fimbriata]
MVTLRADEISNIIRERIEQYSIEVKIVNTGTVLQVGDGIARIHGLDEEMAGELVEFEEGTIGIALNLESNNVGVVLMGDGLMIQEGSSVKATGRIAQIPVSEAYLGRVINALAKPIDGRGKFLLLNLAIGQKASSVAQVVTTFQERGAMEYTIVVAETADSPATLQYLAPYTGAALAEYFIASLSTNVSSIKKTTRTRSLSRRCFYLHSRLLERAAKSSSRLGEGSMTALPIVETQSGDVSAYIPTNVISITDGQIFLSADLFNAGIRPAINVGISVSRVGSAAQIKAMKQVAGKSKLELAQFADHSESIGKRSTITRIAQTIPIRPLTVEDQIVTIYTGASGYLDPLELGQFQEIISSTKTFTEEAEALLKEVIPEQIEQFLLQEQT